jgi:small-conductance mechanosensitive channel
MFLILVRQALLRATEWGTRSSPGSRALQHGFIPLIKNLSTLFVFIMGGIMVLKHFGYDVMSLITALGVGSLAVGLAAKEAISNMISGFVLIMDRNVRAGDRITIGGVTGDIEDIGLRSTRIRTGEGNTMIVPNFDLVNNRIINLSEPSRAGTCTTQIRVPYSADFARVSQISTQILSGIPNVDSSKAPWVNLTSLADGSQLIGIGCWLREMDDAGIVLTQFHEKLLVALKAEQISLVELPPHP